MWHNIIFTYNLYWPTLKFEFVRTNEATLGQKQKWCLCLNYEDSGYAEKYFELKKLFGPPYQNNVTTNWFTLLFYNILHFHDILYILSTQSFIISPNASISFSLKSNSLLTLNSSMSSSFWDFSSMLIRRGNSVGSWDTCSQKKLELAKIFDKITLLNCKITYKAR